MNFDDRITAESRNSLVRNINEARRLYFLSTGEWARQRWYKEWKSLERELAKIDEREARKAEKARRAERRNKK